MPDFGIFRGFNEKLFGDKLYAGQLPINLGLIGSENVSPFLLDLYPNAAAAYSLRLLRSGYTGSAIQVRRASDNTTQNIGFTAIGALDTTALTTFCSGTDGFVTTWYDQSGNGYDATQITSTSQPKIVSSGSVILENTKPSLDFDGSDDFLTYVDNGNLNVVRQNQFSYFSVAKCTKTFGIGNIYPTVYSLSTSSINGAGALAMQFFSNTTKFGFHNTNLVATELATIELSTNANQRLYIRQFRDGAGTNNGLNANVYNYVNNLTASAVQPWSVQNGTISVIGNQVNSNNQFEWQGLIQELIIYPTNLISDILTIDNNINGYYNVY